MIVKKQDVEHVLRAAVAVAGYGRVNSAKIKDGILYVVLRMSLIFASRVKPLGMAIAILDVMQTCADITKRCKLDYIEVSCLVGQDRHTIRTSIPFLRSVLRTTKGKRDLITSNVINNWVHSSRYTLEKGGGLNEARKKVKV